MTREERLYSMRMIDLVNVAENLGIKINKKGAKSDAIAKILEAESAVSTTNEEVTKQEEVKQQNDAVDQEIKEQREAAEPTESAEPAEKAEKPERKRGALIEYKGKSQNIVAWAKELGKSANTLYGRIYKLGWSVEDAFEK